jgi:hypothetical protein
VNDAAQSPAFRHGVTPLIKPTWGINPPAVTD